MVCPLGVRRPTAIGYVTWFKNKQVGTDERPIFEDGFIARKPMASPNSVQTPDENARGECRQDCEPSTYWTDSG